MKCIIIALIVMIALGLVSIFVVFRYFRFKKNAKIGKYIMFILVLAIIGTGEFFVSSTISKSVSFIDKLNKDDFGLDYHYGKDDKKLQIEAFKKQISIAKKYNLPVVIHTRDAMQDTYNILKDSGVIGVIHCFSGSEEMANKFIKLGFYLGIGGVVTFSNSKLAEVVKNIDLSHIILETDSPYLSPFRGKRNEPKNIKVIAEKIALIKGMGVNDVAQITSNNVVRLFDLDVEI